MMNHYSLIAVEQAIERMTLGLRALSQLGPASESDHDLSPDPLRLPSGPQDDPSWLFSSNPDEAIPSEEHWWVLAVGCDQDEDFDTLALEEEEFVLRAMARERLRATVRRAGLDLKEHCWVWDSSGSAQLVLGTYGDRVQAMVNAVRFSGMGLRVRVARRMENATGM